MMAEKAKKKSKWFSKVPTKVLLSPTGFILIFFAILTEVVDFLLPFPVLDNFIELPMETAFITLAVILVKEITLKSMLIPFLLERIPILNDILPTFVIRLIA